MAGEKLKLSEVVPEGAAEISGERRTTDLGLHVFGRVLCLWVGGPKTFGNGTTTRSFKGWFPRGGGSEVWFSVREPQHLDMLSTFNEGTQLYVTGTLSVTKSKDGGVPYTTVRVELLERVAA